MTINEITKHMRNKFKAFGVKARVRHMDNEVHIIAPQFDHVWTREELHEIWNCAQAMKLTQVRGTPIHSWDIFLQLTNATQFYFEVPA